MIINDSDENSRWMIESDDKIQPFTTKDKYKTKTNINDQNRTIKDLKRKKNVKPKISLIKLIMEKKELINKKIVSDIFN